jgi:hypothetical protein
MKDINISVVLSTLSQTLHYDVQSENVKWDEERSSEAPVLLVNEPKITGARSAGGA